MAQATDQPTPPARFVTIAKAAADAGCSVEIVLRLTTVGAYRAYGRRRGSGLLKEIPRHIFAELPTSRLPPKTRYATAAEMTKLHDDLSALDTGRPTEAQIGQYYKGEFAHLPDGIVAPDYIERELDYAEAFYLAPRLRDTWFDAAASIIYADDKTEWTDVRVERLTSFVLASETERSTTKNDQPIYSTGVAGKPTSIQLVENELNERIANLKPGQFLGGEIKHVAESLCGWLKEKHPKAPRLTVKTIANSLGSKIRPYTERHTRNKDAG